MIDGELLRPRAPGWSYQQVANNICADLNRWSEDAGMGEATTVSGITFSAVGNVIPDVVGASYQRLEVLLDDAQHLTGAPEQGVDVLSPGEKMHVVIDRSNSSSMHLRVCRHIGSLTVAYSRCKFIIVSRLF
jgi:Uma2 family endonuclease